MIASAKMCIRDRYYRGQPVNREAVALSEVLCRYRSLGAFAVNEPLVPRDTMKDAK